MRTGSGFALAEAHANLRAALEHLLAGGDKDRALQLLGAIWLSWATRGQWTEGRRLFASALALEGEVAPERLVDGYWGASILALWQGDVDEGEECARRLLELSRKAGLPGAEAIGVHTLAMAAYTRGDGEQARALYEQSIVLARGVDDGWLLSAATNNLGNVYMFNDSRGFGWLSEDDFVDHFAGDVDATWARVMYAVQQPIALSAFEDTMGVPAWKSLPSWYLVSQNDEAIPPDAERMFASRMGATTVEVPSSHVAMVSHPMDVANLIETAAETVPSPQTTG